jgi:chromosome segregation ATPase
MYAKLQRQEKRGPTLRQQLDEALQQIEDLRAQLQDAEAQVTALEAAQRTA